MQTRTPISTKGRLLASALLASSIGVGVIPWKIVSAATEDPTTNRASAPETVDTIVAVVKTFEILPHQSVLAYDGPRPVDNRQTFRQQRRNARRFATPGQNSRGASRSGGTRSSAGGRTQSQGPNSSGAGGFASGTSERPNFGIALKLSGVDQPAMITVAEGSVAIDETGKEYEPMTQLGMARMSVPEFETSHSNCAGAYFRFSSNRRPKSFTEFRGQLRVTPIKLHEAAFDIVRLKRGDRKDTQFGPVSIKRFSNDDGWKFEVTTPGPGRNIREIFQYAGMVDVEIVDSDGGVHKPRLRHGAGGDGRVTGNSAGISEITQSVIFDELNEGLRPTQLIVRIREPGEPSLIPFTVKDVALTNYQSN